jgi:hypothetical protein
VLRLEALALLIFFLHENLILAGGNEKKSHLQFLVIRPRTEFNLRRKLSIEMIKNNFSIILPFHINPI